MNKIKIGICVVVLVLASLFYTVKSLGGGAKKTDPVITEQATDPVPVNKSFVYLGETGAGVDDTFALKAVSEINRIFENGCLKQKIESYKFSSLNNYKGYKAKDGKEVYSIFVKNAPYKLNLRWYSKRFSKVIGYTFNESDIIYSNTRMMGGVKSYAAHLTHELSHQDRAGGFVHWTVFAGSVPYAIGDIASECLKK